tara:strand:- start:646 stop:879 length:234 start_codon:yes stop_codon:yes gene_type:complete
MNRKFVKENKKVLREFLGKAIVSFLTNQGKRSINRQINNDPELKKVSDDLKKLNKELNKRLPALKKTNPELYNILIK